MKLEKFNDDGSFNNYYIDSNEQDILKILKIILKEN